MTTVPDSLAWCIGGVTAGLLVSAYAVVMICLDERRDRQARRRSEYGATTSGRIWAVCALGFLAVAYVPFVWPVIR